MEAVELSRGASLGSVLDPLLVPIYTCDLFSVLEFCGVHMYDEIVRVNRNFATIENVCIQHCLSLSTSKIAVMFGRSNDW